MVFTRFIIAYGGIYARIVANCIALMLIGFSLLYIGYDYLGNKLVVTSFFNPLPEFSTAQSIDYRLGIFIPYEGSFELTSFNMRRAGYVKLRIDYSVGGYTYGPTSPISLTFEVLVNKMDPISRLKKLFTGFKEEYVSLSRTSFEIYSEGSYELYIKIPYEGYYIIRTTASLTDSSMKPILRYYITIVEYREDQDVVIAKWLQFSGSLITGIGVLLFFLSPLIASSYAKALHKRV